MRTAFVTIAAAILALSPLTAAATGSYPAAARSCFERIQTETAKFVDVVHDQVRIAIRRNMQGVTANCAGPRACVGGPKNGETCTSSATCGAAGGVPFQCHPKLTVGAAGIIHKRRAKLRQNIAAKCGPAEFAALFGDDSGSARCPDPSSPANGLDVDELVDCIVRSAAGEFAERRLAGAVGELAAIGAPGFAVNTPKAPTAICAVALGGLTGVGSQTPLNPFVTVTGTLTEMLPNGCAPGTALCPTKGRAEVGSLMEPPVQTFAGQIPICILTTAEDAGNGTPEEGWINLDTGEQKSVEVLHTAIHVGRTCPLCEEGTKVCRSATSPQPPSPHENEPCGNPGGTDIACPPGGTPDVIRRRLDLDTGARLVSAPVHNQAGGVTNPAGTFCGYCDLDDHLDCQSDAECVAAGACSDAVGSGCCVFGANVGAFGDPSRKTFQVQGTKGPFVPQLAAAGCVGRTGSVLIDAAVGLPGPLRSYQSRLNAFTY